MEMETKTPNPTTEEWKSLDGEMPTKGIVPLWQEQYAQYLYEKETSETVPSKLLEHVDQVNHNIQAQKLDILTITDEDLKWSTMSSNILVDSMKSVKCASGNTTSASNIPEPSASTKVNELSTWDIEYNDYLTKKEQL
jgi:hypothetical protein